ncbi:MAG: four helix bundle protein [Akkermansia sp.]|jgi:four helix bundle protein|nr:four helix bundle protein [Akkermansia sp.]
MAESLVSAKSFSFAVRIIHLCRHLKKQDVERELLSQLIRSGTSIAANLSEAV